MQIAVLFIVSFIIIFGIGAGFDGAMVGLVATAPEEKNPHRAAPCEELDPPYDIKLVFVQTITSVLRKINKNCCQQSCTF